MDKSEIEERTGHTSSYEMRARSHKSRNLIVPRMSAITMPLSVPFVLQSFEPF